MGEYVSGLGHQVDLASTYTEALAMMQQTAYDLMVLDKNLPDDTGNPEGGMVLLKHVISENSPYYELINKILHESKKRT